MSATKQWGNLFEPSALFTGSMPSMDALSTDPIDYADLAGGQIAHARRRTALAKLPEAVWE